MYRDVIQQSAKNEKERETLIQAQRINSPEIRMEYGIEKCAMLLIKNGKRNMIEGMEQRNPKK